MGSGRITFIRLNDPAAWETLRPGQFTVFLADAKSDVLLDGDGRPAGDTTSIPVFPSMSEAEVHARQVVAGRPRICAEIYNHQGRSGEPVLRVYDESVRRRFDPELRAKRYVQVGGGLLCAFAIWAVIAANRSSEHFLWFYIVGIKLLTLGTVLFVRGIGFFIGRKWPR